ncbi:MAG TPA: glycosyltransferase family 4 protein [Polyangiaceae bacterium]
MYDVSLACEPGQREQADRLASALRQTGFEVKVEEAEVQALDMTARLTAAHCLLLCAPQGVLAMQQWRGESAASGRVLGVHFDSVEPARTLQAALPVFDFSRWNGSSTEEVVSAVAAHVTRARASASGRALRVLVIAANASAIWGGEAVIPLHVFRGLRAQGHEAWLCVGDETRPELDALLGADAARVLYTGDSDMHAVFRWLEAKTPNMFGAHPYYFLSILWSQIIMARAVRRHVKELQIDIVHQPTPVSPKAPSLFSDLGAPLVVGPMNGGMEYPPEFRFLESSLRRIFRQVGRWVSGPANALFPGKQQAACLLVANARTLAALPPWVKGQKIVLPENAVDPTLWMRGSASNGKENGPLRLIFIGRLVRWKGAEWLIEAMAVAALEVDCHLTVVGDFKSERKRLATRVDELGIGSRVEFLGFQKQSRCAELLADSDALVLPSVFECGGAVVLEAMACAKPVIAVEWGGPADYLDTSCGILVPPSGPEGLVKELATAIVKLARDPQLRAEMGEAGRQKIIREFTWPAKIQKLLSVYGHVVDDQSAASPLV